MTVRIAAFARIREVVGAAGLVRSIADGATAEDVWHALTLDFPALQPLRASSRFAINGVFGDAGAPLREGDELALLPPFGGG